MSLAKMNLPSHSVEFGGQTIIFRGLGFNSLVGLIKAHRDQLDELFTKGKAMMDATGDESTELAPLIIEMLSDLPELTAAIIAYSAGEPDSVEYVNQIPFPTQLEILEKIGELTFNEAGGLGKFIKLLTRMVTKTSSAMNSLG
jgi:hypothetical protein